MPDKRVIVVGTTTDYIDTIEERFPGRAVFLTDTRERRAHPVKLTSALREVTADLESSDISFAAFEKYLNRNEIRPSGITSFDCESLSLASFIAVRLGLPFVSAQSVELARNKYLSKRSWIDAGVRCPQAEIVTSARAALQFVERLNRPVVIKPLSGSGSELTFKCDNKYETLSAFRTIESILPDHPNSRMYHSGMVGGHLIDTRAAFEIEEYVEGREYSADFIIEHGKVNLIRIAKKLPARNAAFGSTLAYIVPARLPEEVSEAQLCETLLHGAQALAFARALCMVDFIVSRDEIVLLEMTPRPGGDCLPQLVRHSLGLDMFKLALDFAEGVTLPKPEKQSPGQPLVGLRLFADRPGTITGLNTARVLEDTRVREVYLKRSVGHLVVLPPDDYDSRILGHVIFAPASFHSLETECRELASMLEIQMEADHDPKFHGGINANSRIAASTNPGS